MSLRDISHQAAIELRQRDTEYVTDLKREQDQLRFELCYLPTDHCQRRKVITERLVRIKELLK